MSSGVWSSAQGWRMEDPIPGSQRAWNQLLSSWRWGLQVCACTLRSRSSHDLGRMLLKGSRGGEGRWRAEHVMAVMNATRRTSR